MKLLKRRDRRTLLEKEIDNVILSMKNEPPDSEEYRAAATNLSLLYNAKSKEPTNRLSKNTVALIVGNFGVVGLALFFEKFNIITTKALNFVMRGRVD